MGTLVQVLLICFCLGLCILFLFGFRGLIFVWNLNLGFVVCGVGFGVQGIGFGVWNLGFGVWCLGFRVSGLGFGVWGVEFRVWGLGFGVWGLGFGVSSFGFRVSGFGFRFSGFWLRVHGSGPARRKEDQASRKYFLEVLPTSSKLLEVALLLPRLSHRLPPTQAGFQGSRFTKHQPSIGHMLP